MQLQDCSQVALQKNAIFLSLLEIFFCLFVCFFLHVSNFHKVNNISVTLPRYCLSELSPVPKNWLERFWVWPWSSHSLVGKCIVWGWRNRRRQRRAMVASGRQLRSTLNQKIQFWSGFDYFHLFCEEFPKVLVSEQEQSISYRIFWKFNFVNFLIYKFSTTSLITRGIMPIMSENWQRGHGFKSFLQIFLLALKSPGEMTTQ